MSAGGFIGKRVSGWLVSAVFFKLNGLSVGLFPGLLSLSFFLSALSDDRLLMQDRPLNQRAISNDVEASNVSYVLSKQLLMLMLELLM